MQGRRTILMVEDEESITVPLSEALAREGFDTQVAGTVAEALELAATVDPDLVLLDVMLPDGSGYDVCRELRRTSRVPIIMLTARGGRTPRPCKWAPQTPPPPAAAPPSTAPSSTSPARSSSCSSC